jgi:hypothetical protein
MGNVHRFYVSFMAFYRNDYRGSGFLDWWEGGKLEPTPYRPQGMTYKITELLSF